MLQAVMTEESSCGTFREYLVILGCRQLWRASTTVTSSVSLSITPTPRSSPEVSQPSHSFCLQQPYYSCVPRRPEFLWSHVLGPLQASAASLSMDRVHGTVYPHPYVHRTSRCAHSSASWSPTMFPHWGCQVPEQPSGAIVTVQRIWRRL